MTQVLFNPPPELMGAASIHHGKCLVCLIMAKGDQVQRTREVWAPLTSDDKPHAVKVIGYAEAAKILDAVTIGINDFFPSLLVPVCWTHLAAIVPPTPGPVCNWCKGTGFRKEPGLQAATALQLPNGGRKRGQG